MLVTCPVDNGQAGSGVCSYRVSAETDAGLSMSPSQPVTVANILPKPPTIVSASVVGQGEVLVKWQPSSSVGNGPIESYEIETQQVGGGLWQPANNSAPQSPYVDEGLVNCSLGSTCRIKVATVTDAGQGNFSTPASVNVPSSSSSPPIPGQPPPPPGSLTAQRVGLSDAVLVQWVAPVFAPVDYYVVYSSTNKGPWTKEPLGPGGSYEVQPEPPLVLDQCPDRETCRFEVSAHTAGELSQPSLPATVQNVPPKAPTGLTATWGRAQ